MNASVPEEVRRLIYAHVPTIDHLEVLVYLVRAAPAAKSVAEILAGVGATAQSVAARLDDLVEAQLVTADASSKGFAYAPREQSLRAAADLLMDVYQTAPTALIRLIYERPAGAAHLFAEAFRLRNSAE